MKKLIVLLISLVLLTGCGKVDKDDLAKDFINKVDSAKAYYVESKMELYSNEDTFKYDLKVYYMDDNYFKVNMLNKNNNHEQVILRDSKDVYVVTPSLNKSYKFSSDWPYNSSQSYILSSLVKDIEEDDNIKFTKIKDGYKLKVDVDYPNNKNLDYEYLYFDKQKDLKRVEVFSKDDLLMIKVDYKKIDYKANLKKKEFDINTLVEENCCSTDNDSEETSSLEDIIYPLYVPTNTYLKDKEMIDTENGERAILTFNGDKNFVLIEETANVAEDFEIIPVYGDPMMMSNTVGSLTSNALSWTSNNINYYLTSSDLSQEEILTIADSLNNTTYVGK